MLFDLNGQKEFDKTTQPGYSLVYQLFTIFKLNEHL
jgi:hypothetical protein